MLKRLYEMMKEITGTKEVLVHGLFAKRDPRSRYQCPYLSYYNLNSDFDVSIYVNNLGPSFSSILIEQYFELDHRIKTMCKFVIHWARIKKLLGISKSYLSSYALILMVIFFLQIQRNPVVDSIQIYADKVSNTTRTVEIPSFQKFLKRKPEWGEKIKYRGEN